MVGVTVFTFNLTIKSTFCMFGAGPPQGPCPAVGCFIPTERCTRRSIVGNLTRIYWVKSTIHIIPRCEDYIETRYTNTMSDLTLLDAGTYCCEASDAYYDSKLSNGLQLTVNTQVPVVGIFGIGIGDS